MSKKIGIKTNEECYKCLHNVEVTTVEKILKNVGVAKVSDQLKEYASII